MDIETTRGTEIEPEDIREAVSFFRDMEKKDGSGKPAQMAFLRALAELARENRAARSVVERLLNTIRGQVPDEETATFKAYYLDGEKKLSARTIGRQFYVDISTVHRRNRKVLESMLVPFFGIDGIEMEKQEGEPHERP